MLRQPPCVPACARLPGGALMAVVGQPVLDEVGEARTIAASLAGGLPVCEGNPREVLLAALETVAAGRPATLAVVLETEGSSYVRAGTLALFDAGSHVGWLSGGCLEPEIERRAQRASANGGVEWLEIDTRDDGALFSGAATGCRGRQCMALLPLACLPGCEAVVSAWLQGHQDLRLELGHDGDVRLAAGSQARRWRLPAGAPGWAAAPARWSLRIRRAPEVWVLGAGPEATTLLPLLHDLGWRATLLEPRERWVAMHGTGVRAERGADLQAMLASRHAPDVALVMHHGFELDRDALETLAGTGIPFVGLLGPPRRRDDLFQLLPERHRAALRHRLHAPVGADLGGRGPQAIALSIAAQLQAWRHGVDA